MFAEPPEGKPPVGDKAHAQAGKPGEGGVESKGLQKLGEIISGHLGAEKALELPRLEVAFEDTVSLLTPHSTRPNRASSAEDKVGAALPKADNASNVAAAMAVVGNSSSSAAAAPPQKQNSQDSAMFLASEAGGSQEGSPSPMKRPSSGSGPAVKKRPSAASLPAEPSPQKKPATKRDPPDSESVKPADSEPGPSCRKKPATKRDPPELVEPAESGEQPVIVQHDDWEAG